MDRVLVADDEPRVGQQEDRDRVERGKSAHNFERGRVVLVAAPPSLLGWARVPG